MTNQLKEYSKRYFLTPAECNPQQRMPLTLLVSRIIEVSTLHANSWNVGYATLVKDKESWVLSRVIIEMERYPKVNENYTLTTWIENFNRHFSERNIIITDDNGNILGHACTIWVVINSITRESVDISKFTYITENISTRKCPIDKRSRLRQVTDGRIIDYTFKYCDIDFNRHVNSCKYVELFLNQWSLDFLDNHTIQRFEIAYIKEASYGENVKIKIDDATSDCRAEITNNDEAICRSRIIFKEEFYK
ncbi:MAG: thioesterase [Muribaculaceae bacterium]|nr:thioesterase [Muribaculaceae bacterium]